MIKYRVQVYRDRRAERMWFAWASSLEEAKSDAERLVAVGWPLCEFSVQPA